MPGLLSFGRSACQGQADRDAPGVSGSPDESSCSLHRSRMQTISLIVSRCETKRNIPRPNVMRPASLWQHEQPSCIYDIMTASFAQTAMNLKEIAVHHIPL